MKADDWEVDDARMIEKTSGALAHRIERGQA